MNYMPKLFVANGVSQDDFITAAGKDAEYAVGMSLYEPSLPSEGNKEFVETHRKKYTFGPRLLCGVRICRRHGALRPR